MRDFIQPKNLIPRCSVTISQLIVTLQAFLSKLLLLTLAQFLYFFLLFGDSEVIETVHEAIVWKRQILLHNSFISETHKFFYYQSNKNNWRLFKCP